MRKRPILVAGHVCLDVIPHVGSTTAWKPGQLVEVGAALVSTGGAVANTGIALHRLGVPVRLCALTGDDLFGAGIRALLNEAGDGLAEGLRVDPSLSTSYTVVLSPPGQDRTFLHCPGGNDAFGPEHLDQGHLEECAHLHFGYPPLMRRMYSDDGQTLRQTLALARSAGLTTSLDLSLPDPSTDQGKAPWPTILATALPEVDVFTPSLDELRMMLGQPGDPQGIPDEALVLALRSIDLGAGAVALKCGADGLLLVTGDTSRIGAAFGWTEAVSRGWSHRMLWSSCYAVNVRGTTGSGDTTIAGLLRGLWTSSGAAESLCGACASGATCCEAPDATSGIQPWPVLNDRMTAGWPRLAGPGGADWAEVSPGNFCHRLDQGN